MKFAFGVLVSFLLVSCGGGENQTPTPVTASALATGKAVPVKAIALPQLGGETDVIVVFDDSAVHGETASADQRSALSTKGTDLIEMRANRIKTLKTQALAAADKNDFFEKAEFSHLPISNIIVRDVDAAERIRKLPGVLGVYKNEVRRKLYLP